MNSLTHDFRRLRHRHLTSQHNLQNTLCFCTCKREIFLFSLESIHNSILFFFHFLCSLLIKLFYSWVSRKWNKTIYSIVYEKFIGNSSFSMYIIIQIPLTSTLTNICHIRNNSRTISVSTALEIMDIKRLFILSQLQLNRKFIDRFRNKKQINKPNCFGNIFHFISRSRFSTFLANLLNTSIWFQTSDWWNETINIKKNI